MTITTTAATTLVKVWAVLFLSRRRASIRCGEG